MNMLELTKAGINVAMGLKRFNGNEALYYKFLGKFYSDPNYVELCNAMKMHDVEAAFHAAHALKGVAGNLSMTRLYLDITPMVECLRSGDLEGAENYRESIDRDYEILINVTHKPEAEV